MFDEKALLLGARQFDEQALAGIYDLYSPEVFAYAARLLGQADLAEECVAETFSRFLKALAQGGGPQNYLRAYLYRTAHNWVVDHYRAQARVIADSSAALETAPDPRPGLLAGLVRQAEAQQVRLALLQLTDDQRQVIVLKYLQGLSNEDVAMALGRPVGAIKALQHRALEKLRGLLQESEDV